MTSSNSYEFIYVLYVLPGNRGSDAALNEVRWGPNELSADGKIKFQDIRALKKVYGSYPSWFRGVPTLVNVESERQWVGGKCINKLKQWRKEWNSRPQTTPVGSGVTVQDPSVIETNEPIKLPPDPMKEAMEKAGWQNEPTVVPPKRSKQASISQQNNAPVSETADDLMSQLQARMTQEPDDEISFNFPPANRDPHMISQDLHYRKSETSRETEDPHQNEQNESTENQRFAPIVPVDNRTVPIGGSERKGILKTDSQMKQSQKLSQTLNPNEDDEGIRTVQFNVSIPKAPKTPTKKDSSSERKSHPTTESGT